MARLSDEVVQILAEAAEDLKVLEAEVITAQFDLDDVYSIEAAIAQVESHIDAAIARYRGNRLVEDAAAAIKAECRLAILQQAADRDTDRGPRTLH